MRFESHPACNFPKRQLISGEQANGDPKTFLQGSQKYTKDFPADYNGESDNPYLVQLYIATIKLAATKNIPVDKHHDLFLRTTEANGHEDETGLSAKFPLTAISVFSANEYAEAWSIWQHMAPMSFISWVFAIHTTCATYKKEWMFNPLLALSKHKDELVSIPQAEEIVKSMGKTVYGKINPKKGAAYEDILDAYDRKEFLSQIIRSTGDLTFALETVQTLPVSLLTELYPNDVNSINY